MFLKHEHAAWAFHDMSACVVYIQALLRRRFSLHVQHMLQFVLSHNLSLVLSLLSRLKVLVRCRML